MTSTSSPQTILILGSGGLSIGQAGEFDYSGSQAIKALKEEGKRTVLINPNIATIQTSKDFANEVYFLPVTSSFVTQVIEKEKPQGILLAFGGQRALNCGIELYQKGVLQKYGVQVLGTSPASLIATEDKGLFAAELRTLGIKTPRSIAVTDLDSGLAAGREIGYPVIVRAGFALGGLGSGFSQDEQELKTLLIESLSHSPQILVEESLEGWKEIEYEVMRDQSGNTIAICNMENFDPLGIHTGESIVVAPSQTLSDFEYQLLRTLSIRIAQHFAIVGECNVQFALDPKSDDYRVIEVNARLSRSSALASKATGYPIAFIAAKVSLGQNLIDIPNPVTKVTKAFFEPAMDYVVVKFPRWDVQKFQWVKKQIGSSMKSVGEVMAVGRKFEEALQKSIRMIHPHYLGINEDLSIGDLENELSNPTDKRIFAIFQALAKGISLEKVASLTRIDPWFLHKINNLTEIEKELRACHLQKLYLPQIKKAKQMGFSDLQISRAIAPDGKKLTAGEVRTFREENGITPCIKQIDTLSAEYPSQTNYLYLTYNGDRDDITVTDTGYIVLGSGPYSIGSSVEFDWCSVECIKTLRKEGFPGIMINCNPETVSTDYDACDRLYFEELSLETILEIVKKESARGVVVNVGGQLPNNLALPLFKAGVNILGTDAGTIDQVEDRHKFSACLDTLGIDQPQWKELSDAGSLKSFCREVGYPVLIRPSYVLSGSLMKVVYDEPGLDSLWQGENGKTNTWRTDHSLVVSKFITDAKEIDMDIVAQNGEIKLSAICEHVENAGVHSGDATLVTPPQKLYLETMNRIRKISQKIVAHLKLSGPVNFQFIAKNNEIKVIECNLRASRSIPFVSKVYDINFIELATQAILGKQIDRVYSNAADLDFVGVKAPQFSFTRLKGADPLTGVEMASTGEVACLGRDLREAFLKALLSTDFKLPKNAILLSTGDIQQKARLLPSVRSLHEKGFLLYGTEGTASFYRLYGIPMHHLHWPSEKKEPNVIDYIKSGNIDLVINIPKNNSREELSNGYFIRRTAADFQVPLITNIQCTALFVDAICTLSEDHLEVVSWGEYLKHGHSAGIH
jgi:carbamoyl-phosphate synthase large subunit